MKATRSFTLPLFFAACLTLFGCKPNAPVQKSSGESASLPAGHGVITGTVDFTGKPPVKIKIDTSMDPACEMSSPNPVFTEQYAVTKGKLGNVFIYVKAGPAQAMQAGPAASQPVVLDQKGCQYTPHVIALMQGGSVEFRNSDLTMHNTHTMPTAVGNETIDVSEGPKGQPVTKLFGKPESMIPVRCNNHPWMNAFINVSQTPYFAVTDANGGFSITGLPPGNYTLGAVHEKLGEKTLQVTVPPTGTAKAEFGFSM